MSAKDPKNAFGRLVDTARAEPVTVQKHGRGVIVVMSVEEYERLKTVDKPAVAAVPKKIRRRG